MQTVFTLVWFSSAIGGALAAVGALLLSGQRSKLFGLATGLFTVAGVLGILSIGILFLLLAVASGIAASRSATTPLTSH